MPLSIPSGNWSDTYVPIRVLRKIFPEAEKEGDLKKVVRRSGVRTARAATKLYSVGSVAAELEKEGYEINR